MNVEAQAINVPTGLQDYRPALYGGIAALELEVDGVRRVPLDVDLAELQRRIVLCYTGEPRNSGHQQLGDHQEAHRRRPARLRLLRAHPRHRRGHARGARSAATGTRSGRAIADEWDNRKRLAPGVTTPAIDDLIARAMRPAPRRPRCAAPAAAGASSATARPSAATRSATALAAGGARVLDYTFERHGLVRG